MLTRDSEAILKRWVDLIVESYPADTAGFLRREKDPFLNPVGHTISQEAALILGEVLGGKNADRLATSLDSIIRIRAVQDFAPSQAVDFVFLLKKAVRDGLKADSGDGRGHRELLEFESAVDSMALLAFDIYMRRREKIHEIRANEIRKRSAWLLDRLNRVYGVTERHLEERDLESSNVKRGNGI